MVELLISLSPNKDQLFLSKTLAVNHATAHR